MAKKLKEKMKNKCVASVADCISRTERFVYEVL